MLGFENITFETPLALLLLLFVPALVAIHYFQRERVLIKASAFFLWREIFEEVKPKNAWMQIFRNLLLFFHALFIILVVLGVSNPHLDRVNFSGENVVLLIDNSASMNTVEHGKTRLERAKDEALMFVARGKHKKFMVLPVIGDVTEMSFLDDKTAASALSSIAPTDASENIIKLLDEIHSTQKDKSAICYFGDANVETTKEDLRKASDVVIVPVGESCENLGIVNLSSRFIPQINDKREVRVVVENFGRKTNKSTLRLYLDERMLLEKNFSLSCGESKSFTAKLSPKSGGILKAVLEGHDAYMRDNVVYNVVSGFSPIKMVFVADSYPARLLRSIRIQKNADVKVLSKKDFIGQYLAKTVDVGDSVGFFYKYLPERSPFKSNIYIDPWNEIKGHSSSKTMLWDREHRIVKNLHFNTFFVPRVSTMPVKNVHTILHSGGSSLIFSTEAGRNLFFAFDAETPGFSTQPAFPLFMRRVVLWFSSSFEKNIKTGEIFRMPVTGSDGSTQVLDPQGQKVAYQVLNGSLSVIDTLRTGVYTVKTKKGNSNFVVQQYRTESNISPGIYGKLSVSKQVVSQNMLSLREPFMAQWKIFAILASLLLLCEWWYQKKGIYALY